MYQNVPDYIRAWLLNYYPLYTNFEALAYEAARSWLWNCKTLATFVGRNPLSGINWSLPASSKPEFWQPLIQRDLIP